MRVGRGPLDEEAIRTLEAGNPDLSFDWTRILKGQAPETAPAERREPDRPDRPDRRERREQRDRRAAAPSARQAERSAETPPATADPVVAEEPIEPTTAAHARLGSEGLARLRARYSETLARIQERVPEAERQAELKELAERLNPDAWVTDADVSAGLESYESTFAALRSAIGPRPSTRQPSV